LATILSLVTLAPTAALAQESSVNTFSPYTMYGPGNLNNAASTAFVGMGGASIGFRNDGFDTTVDTKLNLANPASLSGLAPKSFIFDVGLAGSNVYLAQRDATYGSLKSSFNTFNVNNMTLAFPLARRLGMAINISPFSQVGYRVHTDDYDYLADLGIVRYYYDGQGDVNEAKLSLGWEPFKRLSIGAEVTYMWGNIDRTYQAVILNLTGSGEYSEISSRGGATANTNERVSKAFGAFGVQYTAIDNPKSRLTLGATYRLGGKLRSTVTDYIPSNNIYGDTVRFAEMRSPLRLPQTIGAGVYFHRPKFAVGFDYVWQDWGSANDYNLNTSANPGVMNVRYVNTSTYKLGVQFTPDRYDIRGRFGSFWNRVTYKAGVRYNDFYMQFGGRKIAEKAITVGMDIPFAAMNVSQISVGLELGERGTMQQNLIRERFFKINVGVMLFGRDYDYWFEKYKYN
jgi:hypothetical protein